MNPVLESARFISENSKHVFIGSKIQSAAEELLKMREQGEFKLSNWKEDLLNPKVASEDSLKWIFVIDLLNFSFWANTPEELCVIKWKEGKYTGYWSLCAAINRALDEGIQITDPNYMKNITIEQLNHIFRSENNHSIPLINLRQQVLQEAGKVIIENFDGNICNIVKRANNSALKLVEILVDNFSSFKDQSTFLDRVVYFRKRAQIFVADVWACFEGESYGRFTDIDEITMFADYRVPQGLVYLGALEYSEELSNILNSTMLQPNDPLEIEIRGNSIWSVELILNAMKQILSKSPEKRSNDPLNSISIDFFLWKYAKEKANDPLMKSIPIHKIRTIFY